MYRLAKKLMPSCYKISFSSQCIHYSNFVDTTLIDVAEEVRFGIETGKPVVALESTIITHGMPFPTNIKCALDVEQIVRNEGAIPATVAILNGKLKLGLSEAELGFLGDVKSSKPIKTSRRDLSYVISHKLNGGTTVSGTLVAADKIGIRIFATGGIGGVHRGADKTFDISADLVELGKSNVAVVSSGVKSILDIPKTLEYLETMGVFVATFGDTDEFPAFYSRLSGSKAPYWVKTHLEAAKIIKTNKDIKLRSGMLFAVPVPVEFAFAPELMNNIIEESLKAERSTLTVIGKNVTPFLLTQIGKITGNKSLETNIALIKNNAKTAARIAVVLAELESLGNHDGGEGNTPLEESKGRPVSSSNTINS